MINIIFLMNFIIVSDAPYQQISTRIHPTQTASSYKRTGLQHFYVNVLQ